MILEVGTEIIGYPYDEFKVYDKNGKFLFEVLDPEFNEMMESGVAETEPSFSVNFYKKS